MSQRFFLSLLLLLSSNIILIHPEENLAKAQTNQEQNFDANAQIVLTLKDVEYLQNCKDQQVYLSRQLVLALKAIDSTQLTQDSKLLLMINACNSDCKFMALEHAQKAIQEAAALLKENKLDQSITKAINDYKTSLENKEAYITYESESDSTRAVSTTCTKQQFVCSLLVQDLTVCRSFLVQGPNASSPAFEVSIPENEATFRVPVTINFPSTRTSGIDALTVIGLTDLRGVLRVRKFARFFASVKIDGNLNIGNDLAVGNNAAIGNDLAVANDAAIDNNLAVAVNASIGGNVDLTTNPSTSIAGNITKAGSLYIHNLGSTSNVFVGLNCGTTANANTINTVGIGNGSLNSLTSGDRNIAIGTNTLALNTSGADNIAIGFSALDVNTTGIGNIAIGSNTLGANTGTTNIAIGLSALDVNTTGNGNVALGFNALGANTTGTNNIAIGGNGGSALTTGSNNIAIGNVGVAAESNIIRIGTDPGAGTRKTFIANIVNITTDNNDAIPVLIDSAGQLGTVSSSARYKNNINDIAEKSNALMQLRPVSFNYNKDKTNTNNYGLIAEEVHNVMPELVIYDKENRPETVKYHLLVTLMLNELQKNRKLILQLQQEVNDLKK